MRDVMLVYLRTLMKEGDMKTYLTVDGRELSLMTLNDNLTKTCLVLRGLHALIEATLQGQNLGDKEYSQLILAELALKVIAMETENLLPDWLEATAKAVKTNSS